VLPRFPGNPLSLGQESLRSLALSVARREKWSSETCIGGAAVKIISSRRSSPLRRGDIIRSDAGVIARVDRISLSLSPSSALLARETIKRNI